MKGRKTIVAVILLFALLLSSCGQGSLLPAEETTAAKTAAAAETVVLTQAQPQPLSAFRDAPADSAASAPKAAPAGPVTPERVKTDMFRAKFEGSAVAGSGEIVDGVYRFTATQTDGEAWHVKLECNYPTVAGRDYRVTYRFRSDVAGKVKFGDFQEFEIQEGENSVTGMMIATSGTSYLDLQLGMLKPFTIDFTEIEVEEFADEVEYENALPVPVNFEKESLVWEKHDQGYAPVFTRSSDEVSIEYLSTAWDAGVWKSRLYIRTGLIPESGVHYHITADVSCDQDMPFEVLFNNGEEEKGYGALYGQNLTGGETTNCEAVITGSSEGDELVLQFSLGQVPEGAVVKVGNLHVETIRDHYADLLGASFALNTSTATGKTLYGAIPTSFKNVPLTNFSYSGTDTVFEGHDDGYVVSLEEGASSATLKITQAPESGRGVWKVRLFAATGVTLEAGSTYRIKYDLASAGDQAKYEVLFSGDSDEAYGADKRRSLTAGGTDHVEYIVTPDESHGPLTLRFQLGETDTAAGNTVTLSGLSVEKLSTEYKPVGTVSLYGNGEGNVWEEHGDGFEQTVSASDGKAVLSIAKARGVGEGNIWSSRLYVATGVIPEAGERYRVSAALAATADTGEFEILYQNSGSEELYGGQWELSGAGEYSRDFTAPASGCGELVLVFQLGNSAADNTITLSDIRVCKISSDSTAQIELPGFAYPVVNEPEEGAEPGYQAVTLPALSASEGHEAGYEQTVSGTAMTISAVPVADNGVWGSKLFVDTGTALTAGDTYRVTVNAGSDKAIDQLEILFNNGDAEKGYNADGLYSQTIAAGETKDFQHLFKVGEDTVCANLVLQFQLGKTPAGNCFTVNSVKLEKVTAATENVIDIPAGYYPVEISGATVWENHADGINQSYSGGKLTITDIPSIGVWSSKFLVNAGVTLETGAKYKATTTITASKAMDFEIVYGNGAGDASEDGKDGEKTYGGEYGRHVDEGGSITVAHEFTVPAEGLSSTALQLRLQVGKSPADNTIAVTGFTLEKWMPDRIENQTMTAGLHELPYGFSLEAWDDDGAYKFSLDGNTLTVNEPLPDEHPVYRAKLVANYNGPALTAGGNYRLNSTITSAGTMQYEIICGNGVGNASEDDKDGEKAYRGEYWPIADAGVSSSVQHSFTVPTGLSSTALQVRFQIGLTPAPNTITLNGISLEKEYAEGEEGPVRVAAGYVSVPCSLSYAEQHDPRFVQTIEGNSLKISRIDNYGIWSSKLFYDTGTALEAGEKYKVTAELTATKAVNFEIDYNNGSVEKGYEALYEQSIAEGETKSFEKEFTVAADAETNKLVLQFMLGNSPSGNEVTVNSVTLQKWEDARQETETVPTSVEEIELGTLSASESHDEGYEQTLSGTALTVSAIPVLKNEVWKSRLFVDTGTALEAGKKYKVTANVSSDSELAFEICYNNGSEEKGYDALYELSLAADETKSFEKEFTVAADAAANNLVLQFQLGGSTAPTTFTVNSVTLEKWVDPEAEAGTVDPKSFALEANEGAAASLTGDGESATATVTKSGDDWHIKLYAKPGLKLEEGKAYQVSMTVTGANGCTACYKNTEHSGEGDAEVAFGSETVSDGVVTHSFTAGESGTLEILLKIGNLPAGTAVKVSDVAIREAVETAGDNLMPALTTAQRGNVSFWAHEDYAADLSLDGGTASLAISKTPAEGREPWKIKLFVDTGVGLKAGKLYRISADVSSTADLDYELCCTDGVSDAPEHQLAPTKSGLHAASSVRTVSCDAAPGTDGTLTLQFNLGSASPATVSISNVKVEEVTEGESETVLPSFRYDSVGSFASAADDGYVVSLDKAASSATFHIHRAPAERNPWNVKLNVRTGFTPAKDKGYRVSFDIDADKAQNSFELFLDGASEGAYGQFFGPALPSGKTTVSQIIYPGDSKGELVLQIRLGKTDDTDGNRYTVSNVKIEEVTFRYTQTPEMKEVTTLQTQNGYNEHLEKTRDRATVRIEKVPATGREAWKSKLFVETGVKLREGEKYRVSMDVKSIIPAPFEVCFNNGGVEKGLGAMFGLLSTPSGQHVEYVTYARQDTQLVIQLSLGNCSAPNSIILSNVSVQKAGRIDLISDTIYTF